MFRNFDPWQSLFFTGAALLIALQAWRGWRLGFFRQGTELAGIATAYGASYLIGPRVAPLFRFAGLPDQVLAAIAGSVVALCIYVDFSVAGAFLFKRTAQERRPIPRLAFGSAGTVLGAFFGLFMVWVMTLGIRLCGPLVEVRLKMIAAESAGRAVYRATLTPDPGWMRGLIHIKQTLEEGATGAMLKQVDPLPAALYATIGRVGAMLANPQSVERFLSYPGVKSLAEHPKLIALQNDPQIVQYVMASDFLGLLRNPNVVAAANDSEISAMLHRLDVQKALDYALANGEKPRAPAPTH